MISQLLVACVLGLGAACSDDVPTGPAGLGADTVATYRVTFDATWSANTHPNSFPPNPHFSGLIGGTHNDQFVMWALGELASPGIQNMSELGAKSPLSEEVEEAIRAGTAWRVLSGGGIAASPASVDLTFDINARYPLVSLVSMIAPSPDWFVGVAGLSLIENGRWRNSVTVQLLPYDAGTDSGTIYTSPNAVTAPPETIRRLTEDPFGGNTPLGTFTFVRLP